MRTPTNPFNTPRAAVPIAALLREVCRGVVDAVLPPRCFGCGESVASPHGLCAACWAPVQFIGHPICNGCGLPFDFDMGDAALCGQCIGTTPPFDSARAVVRYDDASRPLLLAFKHGDRTDAAPAFGAWLARVGAEVLAEAELIVPVPLHWRRLLARRYNQAALLAADLARRGPGRYAPDVLVRRRRTPQLGALRKDARRAVLHGAIVVPSNRAERVAGRRVVLVDDVMTTGATVAACSRALRKAGVVRIDVLTVARVVRAV